MPALLPTGSLTGLAFLATAAVIIRFFRGSSQQDESSTEQDGHFGTLSTKAMMKLIQDDVVRHFVVDLRTPDQGAGSNSGKRPTGGFLNVPTADIRRVFSRRGSGEFTSRFPSIQFPRKQDLIVCVSDEARDCRKAVEELEACGFDWFVIEQCLPEVYFVFSSVYVRGEEEESSLQSIERGDSVRYLSRHAVALLLGLTDFPPPIESVVLDVRRMDELVMFGSIQGMKHLTGALTFRALVRHVIVNELPKALTLETETFFEKYHFRKPGVDDVVVTSCRTCKRAIWAAELLMEAGYRKAFVHKTGTQGWRFSASVKAYDEYNLGDIVPRAVQLPKEKPNVSEGFNELESFNLIPTGIPNSNRMIEVESDVVPNYDRTRDAYRMHEGHILERSF